MSDWTRYSDFVEGPVNTTGWSITTWWVVGSSEHNWIVDHDYVDGGPGLHCTNMNVKIAGRSYDKT